MQGAINPCVRGNMPLHSEGRCWSMDEAVNAIADALTEAQALLHDYCDAAFRRREDVRQEFWRAAAPLGAILPTVPPRPPFREQKAGLPFCCAPCATRQERSKAMRKCGP